MCGRSKEACAWLRFWTKIDGGINRHTNHVLNLSGAAVAPRETSARKDAWTGVHTTQLQPRQGPIPGPAPARLPWSELAPASNAAAAPG